MANNYTQFSEFIVTGNESERGVLLDAPNNAWTPVKDRE